MRKIDIREIGNNIYELFISEMNKMYVTDNQLIMLKKDLECFINENIDQGKEAQNVVRDH